MLRKAKKCRNPECNHEFFPYSSLQKGCSPHCERVIKGSKNKPVNKKSIAPISQKRLGEMAVYRPLRDKYLNEHPICEVHDCNNPSNQLHHKKGRVGKLLYDDEFFMACCGVCHPARIHENSEWSYEHGYLISK